MNTKLRIVYMGTPGFAVEPLRSLCEAGYEVAAVVTAPDKPAGRGRKLTFSPVKTFALQAGIPVLQPINLKDPDFISELQSYQANLQVVVAFRMLPEAVWSMPALGTLNLHASLLPDYRGAAPINHVLINGETETGVTTFFIEKEIDTGKIILSRKIDILPDDDAGSLHDRLMTEGSQLILRTLERIESGNLEATDQQLLMKQKTEFKPAPKIFKTDCRINWNRPCRDISNLIRGLSPFPGAYSEFNPTDGESSVIKIYRSSYRLDSPSFSPGTITTDGKTFLEVQAADGVIRIEELQMEGKKRMSVPDFLRGASLSGSFE
jgi:methionyl-tRNA formyltransferase